MTLLTIVGSSQTAKIERMAIRQRKEVYTMLTPSEQTRRVHKAARAVHEESSKKSNLVAAQTALR